MLLTRLLARQFQFLACRQVEWLPAAVTQNLATVAPYMASGASLAHMVSIWTMVVITVDRYIAVCLPGEVQLRTVRRVKVAVAYVTVLSTVCCLPLKVKDQGHQSQAKVTRLLSAAVLRLENRQQAQCSQVRREKAEVGDHRKPGAGGRVLVLVPVDGSWWFIAHQIVCDCLIRTLIPFIMLVVLSSRMVVRLRRMTRQFRSPNDRRRQPPRWRSKTNWRKNMMATLFAVVGLFAVCQLPRLIVRVSVLLLEQSPDIHLDEKVVQRVTKIASGLLVVHATANFFIYCLVGNSFRRSLARMCSRRTARSTTVTTDRRDELLMDRTPKASKPADHT